LKWEILRLLREGCIEAKSRLRGLEILDSVYLYEGKLCVAEREELALWAVLNNLLREEDVAPYLSWRAFEGFVSKALYEAGYEVIHSLRVKVGGKRMEFDVVGYDNNKVIVVECKRWSRMSRSELVKIAESHRKRVLKARDELRKFGKKGVPVLITLRGYPLYIDSIVVPIRYLQDFLTHLDEIIYDFGYVQLQQ